MSAAPPFPIPSPVRDDDDRWAAIVARDARRDGEFVFAVRTTGIYCRPSCPSRRPKRQNVEFFDLDADAERANYRACKRCKPKDMSVEQRNALAVVQACRAITTSPKPLKLEELAQAARMSPFHFHRIFKRQTSLTPKQYAKARQDERLRGKLCGSKSVTAAIHAAGFESAGRFYERAMRILGMTPSDYRDGGRGQLVWYACSDSTLGRVLAAGTIRGICAIRFGDNDDDLARELQHLFPKAKLTPAGEEVATILAHTVAHIERPEAPFPLPLDIEGTVFQQKVWAALQNIPFGATASYSDIAARMERASATRAVANACGANPVAVAIPCHRVLRADGGLGGYRWGVERKKVLLQRERRR